MALVLGESSGNSSPRRESFSCSVRLTRHASSIPCLVHLGGGGEGGGGQDGGRGQEGVACCHPAAAGGGQGADAGGGGVCRLQVRQSLRMLYTFIATLDYCYS